jgi:hypothetical protein
MLANLDKYRLSGEMMFSHDFSKMPILTMPGYKTGYKFQTDIQNRLRRIQTGLLTFAGEHGHDHKLRNRAASRRLDHDGMALGSPGAVRSSRE